MSQYTFVVMWQYCKDPNEINNAIVTQDENWEGLTNADQIISITWDANSAMYLVFWKVRQWMPGGENG